MQCRFKESFEALAASAQDGCELCALLWDGTRTRWDSRQRYKTLTSRPHPEVVLKSRMCDGDVKWIDLCIDGDDMLKLDIFQRRGQSHGDNTSSHRN